MTTKEFNEEYSAFLEKGHYGLDISHPEFIDWLNIKFQDFISRDNFSYSQIKVKFGMGRFYCEGLSDKEIREVEDKITELCKR